MSQRSGIRPKVDLSVLAVCASGALAWLILRGGIPSRSQTTGSPAQPAERSEAGSGATAESTHALPTRPAPALPALAATAATAKTNSPQDEAALRARVAALA